MRVLWDLVPDLDPTSRHAILKIMERLSSQYHRNRAVLSNLRIVSPLFHMLLESKKASPERPIIQKILKRTLELGVSTPDARVILQHAINEDETLNPEILDIIRSASKGRWPRHFSLDSPAALYFKVDGIRGAPPTGFTFMVRLVASVQLFCTHRYLDMDLDRTFAEGIVRRFVRPSPKFQLGRVPKPPT